MPNPHLPMLGSDLSRRSFVRNVLLGTGVLSLPDVWRMQAEAALSSSTGGGKKRSLILLWQDGGPSHFETFDPKPEAPDEIRGELGAIPTTLTGIRFCELLPRLASIAHRFSVIRSLHQPSSGHVEGSHNVLTGWDGATVDRKSRYPDFASVIHRMRSGVEESDIPLGVGTDPRLGKGMRFGKSSRQVRQEGQLPQYIALGRGLHRGGPGYLGGVFGPFEIVGDASKPFFQMKDLEAAISQKRLIERWNICRTLESCSGLNQARRHLEATGQVEVLDGFQQQAFDLLTGSGAAARAFDLTREDRKVRERYGLTTAGQQALLARRLVEAGVSVVAVRFCPDGRGDYPHKTGLDWDDHAVHGNIFAVMKRRAPKFDQAVSALIEDLDHRGMSDDVLVAMLGEFGRTPRVHVHKGCPGREHWGPAGCALVYGGGLKMGQVIGSTNKKGERPDDRPLKTQSLLATIYRQLGIDCEHVLSDGTGQRIPILRDAHPIEELVG